MSAATPAFDALTGHYRRIGRFSHVEAILGWDQEAMMPPGGQEARAAAQAELGGLIHQLRTGAQAGTWLEAAAQEPLDPVQQAGLREMLRDWRAATALPQRLVEEKSLATSRCEFDWRRQRPANDWPGFLENFREVLRLSREEAALLSGCAGSGRYDALLERYEPGMRTADIERLFGELRSWLPALVARVEQRQAAEPVLRPQGPFPVERQRSLGRAVVALLGFDFAHGRLDESAHPFTGGVPEDVRMTTRYRAEDFVQALMGCIHETGHARYEQGLPAAWRGLPLGQARSFGVHESQSLSFEMQLARGPGFARLLAPLLEEHLGPQPAFAPENLQRLLTRVRRGFIRVEADEVTYPAHVILRFEIERALIEGDIEAEDIPAWWDERMADLLGLDTRGNVADGCLQDVHWTHGAFGYFPSYTLGALYAAQWFAAIRAACPDLEARVASGDLTPVTGWMARNVWSQASRWETPELVRRACGGALDAGHFRTHLEQRYLR